MIEQYRKEIDHINRELIDLLARRAEASKKIGDYKRERDMNIRDPEREEAILVAIAEQAAKKGLNPELTKDIFRTIFKFSYDTQK